MSPKNNGPSRTRLLCGVLCFAYLAIVGLSNLSAHDDEPKQEIFNAEAAKIKNPLQATKEHLDAGEKLYVQFCGECHGKKGKGDGGLALGGSEVPDITDATWNFGATDGEIFMIIKEGVPGNADMLSYKDRLKDEQMWQTVLFIRTLGPKEKK